MPDDGTPKRHIWVPAGPLAHYIDDVTQEPIDAIEAPDLTIVVGETNAGKSRFLRALLAEKTYRLGTSPESFRQLHAAETRLESLRRNLARQVLEVRNQGGGAAVKQLKLGEVLEASLERKRRSGSVSVPEADKIVQQILQPAANSFVRIPFERENEVRQKVREAVDSWKSVDATPTAEVTPERIYIPTMRTPVGLITTSHNPPSNSDVHAETIRGLYGLAGVSIATGFGLYDDLTRAKNSKLSERMPVRRFEAFLSKAFFDEKEVELTSELGPGRRVLLCVGSIERPLHDLGDGINAVVVLTYSLFMAKAGTWVFVEEPENSLHPGLQRLFIETVLTNEYLRSKGLRVFITTHSNHLLDVAISHADKVAVYGFRKLPPDPNDAVKERFAVRKVFGPIDSALDDLGVLNASVALANCTLWVEGPTDRLYLRAYLRSLMAESGRRQFQEDRHFAFVEYGGSNIAHYDFDGDSVGEPDEDAIRARFVANRAWLLADRDEGKDARHERRQAWSGDHFQYCVTEGREIENEIPGSALVEAITDIFGAERDAVLAGVKHDDYREVRLGTFLGEHLGGRWPSSASETNGNLTTRYKLRLAHSVSRRMEPSMLEGRARRLAESAYAFIEKHNPPPS